jgi:hypothetical protein
MYVQNVNAKERINQLSPEEYPAVSNACGTLTSLFYFSDIAFMMPVLML